METNLIDGDYLIDYEVSGANEFTKLDQPISIAGTVGQLSIPGEDLINPGNNSITITNVDFDFGLGCGVMSTCICSICSISTS